ncbi:Uncharacterized protein Rs2_20423 [Raphanus sativus]|nr:Uncharacterized protein Rs2_20423 [Raphanus sativus]
MVPEKSPAKDTSCEINLQANERRAILAPAAVTENIPRSRAEIMEELHEVTQQYLSCADPIEAAARRQRVLFSDAQGLMEQTATNIIAATANVTLRSQTSESNPMTPPPMQNHIPLMLTSLHQTTNVAPQLRDEEEDELSPHHNVETLTGGQNSQEIEERPARIRSIIISPAENNREHPMEILTPMDEGA